LLKVRGHGCRTRPWPLLYLAFEHINERRLISDVWELETGRRGAYPRTAKRLAKALETEVADLVGE
jgi:hypothetical protein